MSNNLDFQTLSTSMTGKEAAVNTALGELDAVITDIEEYILSGTDTTVTPTELEWQRHRVFRISENGGTPLTTPSYVQVVTTNLVTREFVIHNNTSVPVQVGSGIQWVAPGAWKTFYYDGTTLSHVSEDRYSDFWHQPITAISSTNVTIGSTGAGDSVDGAGLDEGDIVLLTAQTTATENGLYVVGASSLARVPWQPSGNVVVAGVTITARFGTTNANKTYKLTNTVTLDTDTPLWVPVNDNLFALGAWFAGTVAASTRLFGHITVVPFRLPASLTGSDDYALTAPSGGDDVYTIYKNGSSIGTITFADGSNTATYSFASDVDFAAGDRLDIQSAATMNGSADVMITLKGQRI
jgi:hypothetical protein